MPSHCISLFFSAAGAGEASAAGAGVAGGKAGAGAGAGAAVFSAFLSSAPASMPALNSSGTCLSSAEIFPKSLASLLTFSGPSTKSAMIRMTAISGAPSPKSDIVGAGAREWTCRLEADSSVNLRGRPCGGLTAEVVAGRIIRSGRRGLKAALASSDARSALRALRSSATGWPRDCSSDVCNLRPWPAPAKQSSTHTILCIDRM
mmetsp:Transcript_2400/g.4378  ORF Transcript_2400/g.4378 Transcript_2400/m.4378 type:complete len:204 (+) Transcript_2400:11-622(+)